MDTPLDPYAIPDDQVGSYLGVKKMVELLNSGAAQDFFVHLTRYSIEGESYRASGLSISPTRTPNLVQTQTGFKCNAFFTPDLLTDHARKGKKVVDGFVQVGLEVLFGDIWMISVQTSEGAIPLFSGTPKFF